MAPWMPEPAWNAFAFFAGALVSGLIGFFFALWQHRLATKQQRDNTGIALYVEIALLINGVKSAIAGSKGDASSLFTCLYSYFKNTPIFENNTDKIGLFGGLGGEIVGLYNNLRFHVLQGGEACEELKKLPRDPHPQQPPKKLDENLRAFIPKLVKWVEEAEKVHGKLGHLCNVKFSTRSEE